jgi:hypothetical protein
MSRKLGTFSKRHSVSAKRLDISKGKAAFLAPEMVTVPANGWLGFISNLSMIFADDY